MSMQAAPDAAPASPSRRSSATVIVAWITTIVFVVGTLALTIAGGVLVYEGRPQSAPTSPPPGPGAAEVFMAKYATQAQIDGVAKAIKASPEVTSSTFVTKQAAYEDFKQIFKDQPDLVNSVSPEALPVSFRVVVRSQDETPALLARIKKLPGVEETVDRDKDRVEKEQSAKREAAEQIAETAPPSISDWVLGWWFLGIAGVLVLLGLIVLIVARRRGTKGVAA